MESAPRLTHTGLCDTPLKSFDYEAFKYCRLQVAVKGRTEEEESRSVYCNADMFYGRENYQNVYINLTNQSRSVIYFSPAH